MRPLRSTLVLKKTGLGLTLMPGLVLLVTLLLAGCGQSGPECPPCPEVVERQDTAIAKNTWPSEAPADEVSKFLNKYVLKADLDAARCYFRQRVKAVNSAGTLVVLDSAAVVVNWQSLSAAMNTHFSLKPPPSTDRRAIRLIYGLSVNGSVYRFTPFIQFMQIGVDIADPEFWDIKDESVAIYGIDADDGELHPASKKELEEATGNYADHIHIRRTAAPGFSQFTVDDTRDFSFHWEHQLVPLIAHNSTPKFLKFTSIAEDRPGVGLYTGTRHHLVAVTLNNTFAELIGNDPVVAGVEYQKHGSDIGSACPPQCATRLHFPANGLNTPVCP